MANADTGRPRPVLIDCDPGIDDALALCDLLARRAGGEIEMPGIIVTAGNLDLESELANTLGWLALAAQHDLARGFRFPAVPVHPGAAAPLAGPHPFTPETHGPRGAGYAVLPQTDTQPATVSGATAWLDLSHRYAGQLHAIVTGPLTTLAQAIQTDPLLPTRLASLTVMGGAFFGYPGNTTPVAEWNCHCDPEAARIVSQACADTAVPMRWCGQNVTDYAQIFPADVTALLGATRGAPLTRALAAALRWYFEFHAAAQEGYHAKIHDAAAVAVALDPARGQWRRAQLEIACDDPVTRGMTVAEMRPERWTAPANAEVLCAVTGAQGAGGLVREWAHRHVLWLR